jgi:hypothetical protein
MFTDCQFRENDEYAAPRPSAGVFDSPAIPICLNTEWASHLDGLLQRLLCAAHWDGTETEVEATVQQVQTLIAKLADIQECPTTEARVHYIGEPFSKFTATVPAGAIPMDGELRLQADYPALMPEIPSGWKSGIYFTLPDMKGRSIVGAGFEYKNYAGTPYTVGVGSGSGQVFHTLTVDEIPSHRHQENFRATLSGSPAMQAVSAGSGDDPSANYTGYTGGGLEHNNMPPFLAGYWFIQAE